MTHLGADVAAFVDGQLPPVREVAARQHLVDCARCREAMAAQEQLKRRMGRTGTPGVPQDLARSLSALALDPPPPEPHESRLLRPLGAAAVLTGASMAVLLLAYLLAPGLERDGDPVRPDVEAYVAQFVAEIARERSPQAAGEVVPAGLQLSSDRLDELTADGWPCHETLAGELRRLDGHLVDTEDAVSLRYSDGRVRLQLVEQVGSVDREALEDFRPATVASSAVMVRDGVPTVVTWDAEGVVYTIVTDAGWERIEDVVAQLPTTPARETSERIDDGLERMTSWVTSG